MRHFTGARERNLPHETGIADGGLLEAPQGFAPVERRDPDGQCERGEEHEGGEWNDEAPVKAAAPHWILIGHKPSK